VVTRVTSKVKRIETYFYLKKKKLIVIFKMVQGEKQTTLTTIGNSSRTSDPSARKAGYEAVQRMDQTKKDQNKGTNGQYGSWGPVFKNKSNFAEQHWC